MTTLIALLMTVSAHAGPVSSACEDAAKIAQQYLDLDLQGERTHSSKKVDALIDSGGGDTPGFDTLTVVKNAKISGCQVDKNKATITISYTAIGDESWSGPKGDVPAFKLNHPLKVETAKLILKKKTGWKVDAHSVDQARIGIETAQALLKERQEKTTNPDVKNACAKISSIINAQK